MKYLQTMKNYLDNYFFFLHNIEEAILPSTAFLNLDRDVLWSDASFGIQLNGVDDSFFSYCGQIDSSLGYDDFFFQERVKKWQTEKIQQAENLYSTLTKSGPLKKLLRRIEFIDVPVFWEYDEGDETPVYDVSWKKSAFIILCFSYIQPTLLGVAVPIPDIIKMPDGRVAFEFKDSTKTFIIRADAQEKQIEIVSRCITDTSYERTKVSSFYNLLPKVIDFFVAKKQISYVYY